MSKSKTESKQREVLIKPPDLRTVEFLIIGTAPYVQCRFGAKARNQIIATQTEGSGQGKKKKAKPPKDWDGCYEDALHRSEKGWCGIPATAFRGALIRACALCEFTMTDAKCTLFVEADGYDPDDGTPLVKITKGAPERHSAMVRNANGQPDVRVRPLWKPGWEALVRVTYDGTFFKLEDVANLMHRAGLQIGVGEGRPLSKKSQGMGWGTFRVQTSKEAKSVKAAK